MSSASRRGRFGEALMLITLITLTIGFTMVAVRVSRYRG